MANNKDQHLLLEIAQILADDSDYPLNGTLLYADLTDNIVGLSTFKDCSSHVLFRWFNPDRLSDALLDLWEIQDLGERWAEIEYIIRDGKFDVTYTYPEAIDLAEDDLVRRDRIVRRHFGDKPIIYPPLPTGDNVPAYEL